MRARWPEGRAPPKRSHPGAFLDEAHENVFGADLCVEQALGHLVSQVHDLAGHGR